MGNQGKPVVRAETCQPTSPSYTELQNPPSHAAARGASLHRHSHVASLGFRKQGRPGGQSQVSLGEAGLFWRVKVI